MTRRPKLVLALAAAAACALPASPAAASTVSMEEITQGDGTMVGKFFFTATLIEVNQVVMTFGPANQVWISDSAGMNAVGRCSHPTPADRTVVYCDGADGVPYDTAYMTLGAGNDSIVVRGTGGATPTTDIESGPGNDRILGGPGVDSLYDAAGSDLLSGGAGRDFLFGKFGNDRLYGGPGNARLDGGPGHDRLFGATGSDYLLGGPGNDFLITGAGRDIVVGGEGRNLVDGRRG